MAIELSDEEFEELVDRALEKIPDELIDLIDNCLISIEQDSPAGVPTMLGLYEGFALTERSGYSVTTPDMITLYQNPLLSMGNTIEAVEHQVFITVVHEIGHHFGIDDERLHELNWG